MKKRNKANNPRPLPNVAPLAERLKPTASWKALPLPESERLRLGQIVSLMKRKATMADSLAHSSKISPGAGVSALFAGPSGPGKAMAAGALAKDLHLPLFRIDLRRIASKYIGETEKNLERVFKEAEPSHGVLFFDEADALFGKRAEVVDSHDRFANIEVAYLLERMETHPGLVILASPLASALEKSFVRRLDFVIKFRSPTRSRSAE